MILLDGKTAREFRLSSLRERIEKLSVYNSSTPLILPCLVIIQVGSREDSNAFIKAKKSFAQKIGVKEIHIQLDEQIGQEEIIALIEKYNNDASVHGIIVQLPLPIHLDSEIITNSIDPAKDVDGLTSSTQFTPATARGVSELFDFYDIDLKGKSVVVIGRSKLVGIPLARMCEKKGAVVTVCHSETKNITEITKKADIVVVAIGKPQFINETFVTEGQIVIDVGITRVDGKLAGDVDFEKVQDIVAMITPVPGGVGQMTVLALFENLIDACYTALN